VVKGVNLMTPKFDYIKCPLHRYTFSVKPIREWVESECEGDVLNLFAGPTKLNVRETRVDLNPEMIADFNMDALDFVNMIGVTSHGEWDTILLDPPFSYRKSMEMYKGIKASPFRQLKDSLPTILRKGGKIITFGYFSNVMGANRGFEVEKICVFSHGGAIHDTIASVERKIKEI
jgi:hypothetical protein